jgi:GNAT superfamily N-acetyltransferase
VATRVRRAERQDAKALLNLVCALADYEKLARPTEEAQERLLRDGWPPDGPPRFEAWLAELDAPGGAAWLPVGYAVTFYTYSSFLARPTLYIEDIFVLPEQRRSGVGTALFQALAATAKASGCGRMEWVVLDWNTLAQDFYRKHGAQHLADWQCYRLPLRQE